MLASGKRSVQGSLLSYWFLVPLRVRLLPCLGVVYGVLGVCENCLEFRDCARLSFGDSSRLVDLRSQFFTTLCVANSLAAAHLWSSLVPISLCNGGFSHRFVLGLIPIILFSILYFIFLWLFGISSMQSCSYLVISPCCNTITCFSKANPLTNFVFYKNLM